MSLFDTLKDSLGGLIGSSIAAALPDILAKVVPGGLQGLLDQLQRSGYGAQVNSWLGRDANQPITADDLSKVLGNEHVRQIAEKLGIPADQVLATLSKLLPAPVDQASPDGTLQTPPATR